MVTIRSSDSTANRIFLCFSYVLLFFVDVISVAVVFFFTSQFFYVSLLTYVTNAYSAENVTPLVPAAALWRTESKNAERSQNLKKQRH